MILLVRDEADIIADNIRFHLAQGVDFVVAIDNGSVDGTRDILQDFERSGVARVFDEPGRNYDQTKWVTRAAQYARDELAADWLFSNDADEFWTVPGGTIRDMLHDCSARLLTCNRLNMVYPWDAPGNADWRRRLICRVARPVPRPKITDIYGDMLGCPYFYLALPPKVMMQARGLKTIAQGNHAATYETAVEPVASPVEIFHYPVRSARQFEKKVVQGGQAYLANPGFPEMFGWHWRRWYRAFQTHGIDAPLRDALPSKAALDEDLRTGTAVVDRRFAELFGSIPGLSGTERA